MGNADPVHFGLVNTSHATAYLSIVADHADPSMATIYPSSNAFFQHDNAPNHKKTFLLTKNLNSENLKRFRIDKFTALKWTRISM